MIELKDLEIRYGDYIAVHEVDIDVEEGEFFTFLGPSGCGKTTILRSIAGFIKPSKGQIILANNDITDLPPEKREIGMVFQSYALFPTMTVFDNIAYGLKVDKMPKDKIYDKVREMAGLVEIKEELFNRNVSELSGGQQQRVAIARALAKDPKLILFDEPLSNLDAKLRKQLRQEIKSIQRKTGMTAIYVTHDQEEALEMSDRIAVFNKGYVEQIGKPLEIYDKSKTEFVCTFIGESNKIDTELIQYINNKSSNIEFDDKKVHYIREEKILLSPSDKNKNISIKGKVSKIIYEGAYSHYIIDVLSTHLSILEKNDSNTDIKIDDEIEIYINPADILEYEVEE